MRHDEMVDLIRGAVPRSGGIWADLGAGTGNFTRALSALLGSHATIYAVDKYLPQPSLQSQGYVSTVQWQQADFTGPMALPMLDGILIANALHFVTDQAKVLAHICSYLRPGGRFVLVEYRNQSSLLGEFMRKWLPLAGQCRPVAACVQGSAGYN